MSSVEKQIVKTQLENIVKQLTSDLDLILDDNQRKLLSLVVNNITVDDMKEEDDKVEENNKKLKLKTLIIFSTIILVSMIFIAFLYYKNGIVKDRQNQGKIFMKDILGLNLVMILVVALTYFLFIKLVVSNYGLVDSNFVKHVIIKRLKEKLYS